MTRELVVVSAPDPKWAERAAVLIAALHGALGAGASRIDHIGSTAIPAMDAKDVLGAKRATFAVAHNLLVIAYHVLSRGVTFADLGSTYFDERDRERTFHRLTRRLEALGYHVEVAPASRDLFSKQIHWPLTRTDSLAADSQARSS